MVALRTLLLFMVFSHLFCSEVVALHEKADSATIAHYNDLCLKHCYNNPDSALYFVEQGIRLSKKAKNQALLAQAYNRKGIVFDVMNSWDSSLHYYDLAIDFAERSGNLKTKASAFNNKGLIHWNRSEYDKAIQYYQQAVTQFEQLGQKKGMANALNNVAVILQEEKRFAESLKTEREVLRLYTELDDQYGISASYSNMGLVHQLEHRLDSARYYLNAAIKIKRTLPDLHGLAITYTNLSEVFEEEQNYDSAINYVQQAIEIHRKLGDLNLVANNLSALGSLYFTVKDLNASETALLEGLRLSQEVGAKKIESGIYQRLSAVAKERGDYELALKYMTKRMTLYAEVYEKEKEEVIAEMMEKYEAKKRENLIEQRDKDLARQEVRIKNRNIQLILIISGFCVLLLLGIVLFLHQKNKQHQLTQQVAYEKIQAITRLQDEKLRISSDLHDNVGAQLTFVISTLDNLMYTKNDDKRGEMLSNLRDFAKSTMSKLRETVWALKLQDVTAEDLTVRVADFINQARKACPDVNFQLEQNDFSRPLTAAEAIQVYHTIQEAINNAIKHGNPKNIRVAFNHNEIVVQDDGSGFEPESISSGHGLEGMRSRMKRVGLDINIASSPGHGTRIGINMQTGEKSNNT